MEEMKPMLIAVTNWDENVKIVDLQKKTLRVIPAHSKGTWIQYVCFSPFIPTMFVTCGNDFRLIVWNKQTLHATLTGHTSWVFCCCFCGEDILASGSIDCTIRIWSISTGETLHVLAKHEKPIRSLAFSISKSLLFSVSDDNTIRTWDLSEPLSDRIHSVWECHLSYDESCLLTCSRDGTISLWSTHTIDYARRLLCLNHDSSIYCCAFSQDAKLIACGSCSKSDVLVYDLNNIKRNDLNELEIAVIELSGHRDVVYSLAFSADSKHLVSVGYDEQLIVWDLSTKSILYKLQIS